MKQEIIVPINNKLGKIIDKVRDRNSPYLLGLLKEDYTDGNL